MSVRQYIGARYVPIMCGDYDETRVYEPLSVVLYNGASYTTKKHTRAGILPTNEEFWVVTGNYNLQVETYRQEVVGVGKKVEELRVEVEETINNEIATINGENRRYIVLSDSYGLGRNNTIGWTAYLKELLGATDNNYFTFSSGSSGFVRVGEGNHTMLTLLQAKSGVITNHETITDIVVGCGANDILEPVGVESAIGNFVTYCRNTYPNAKVWIGFIGHIADANGVTVDNYLSVLRDYRNATYSNGATFMEGLENIMHDATYMQSDKVHPTSAGSLAIAKGALTVLWGKPYKYFNHTTTYVEGDLELASNVKVLSTICGDTTSIEIRHLTVTNGVTFNNRELVKIGDIGGCVNGTPGKPIIFTTQCLADGDPDLKEIRYTIYEGGLYVSAFIIGSKTTGALSISGGIVTVPTCLV